jgi:hypothetical protein
LPCDWRPTLTFLNLKQPDDLSRVETKGMKRIDKRLSR